MKFKSIIACGLLLLGVGAATTSCEDMFTAENSLVATDLAPKDTLYQVMGIIQRMQKLADRTVLLGEVRADLLEIDPIHASADIQELYNNNISTTNEYNSPAEYYAVINNCNIYLAGVDSMRMGQGTRRYYEKEICAVKGFRAWCYLELCKIYGQVPFITEPVLTSDVAEDIVASGKKADMNEILTFCINDLKPYPYMDENKEMLQSYGNTTYGGHRLSDFVIPFRPLLAELYLWRASYTGSQSDYIDAIRLYHDFFTFPDEEISVRSERPEWYTREFQGSPEGLRWVGQGPEAIGFLPLDTTTYYGNVTDLRAVFNSQYSNNYYPAVVPSERMKTYSYSQPYCLFYNDGFSKDTLYAPVDPNAYTNKEQRGDLRLPSVWKLESNFDKSQFNSDFSPILHSIDKFDGAGRTDERKITIPYFRKTILYLHLAEALNRAGFPETAYLILTRGISYFTLNDRDFVSQDEFDRLCEIKSYGFSRREPRYTVDSIASKTSSSFVIWPSNVFGYIDRETVAQSVPGHNGVPQRQGGNLVQIGIHSLGCGDSEYDKTYYLDDSLTLAGLKPFFKPTAPVEPKYNKREDPDSTIYYAALEEYNIKLAGYNDTLRLDSLTKVANVNYLASPEIRAKRQARVKELILDEEALEGAFEGYRFYDILRYQMQEGKIAPTITLPEYLEKKYGKNEKDNMTGKPWYLTLPKR